MSWNYRVVRYLHGGGFGLHEVYYRDDGVAYGMTERPCGFACWEADGITALRLNLEQAAAACYRPVFDEPAEWPAEHRLVTVALDALAAALAEREVAE